MISMTNQNTMDQEFSLRRIFLPLHGKFEGEKGWQFGVSSRQSPRQGPLTIKLLMESGDVYSLENPDFTHPSEPEWAWVPFPMDGGVRYARIRRPQMVKGSYLLSRLKDAGADFIEAPGGRDALFDLAQDIPVDRENGWYTVRLGMTKLLSVEIRGGAVSRLYPIEAAYKMGLWTSHIARLAFVFREDMQKIETPKQSAFG